MNAREQRKLNQVIKKVEGRAASAQEQIDAILLLVADYQEFLTNAAKELRGE